MNPLLLLLGLIGAGTAIGLSGKSAAPANARSTDTGEKKTEDDGTNTPVVGDTDSTGTETPDTSSSTPTEPTEPTSGTRTGGETTEPETTGGTQTGGETTEPETTGGTQTGGETTEPETTGGTQTGGETTEPETTGGTQTGGETTEPETTGGTQTGGETTEPETTGGGGVTTPTGPSQTGSETDGAETTPIIADGTVNVMAGRVATLSPGANDVVSLRIVSEVNHGTVTVNPDNTFALVMTQSNFTGNQSFTYEATHSDGSTSVHQVGLNVGAGAQAAGWGTGEGHYMLATDENDKVIVEHGDDHHKVYISGGNTALSRADIANIEGLSVSQITGNWLANSQYGQTEDLALNQDAGMALWNTVTPRGSETSNWLLLERGHDYGNLGRILNRDTHGEDETHPLHIGAWGTGDAPEVTSEFFQYNESSSNVVIQDVHFSGGVFILYAENIIFDNIKVTGEEMSAQGSTGITVHNSEFIDIFQDAPTSGNWDLLQDRIQGLYMGSNEGVLIEGNLFDQIGWEEGYRFDLQADGAMPPSMWSHNMYFAQDVLDVTLRDTITMHAASSGALLRGGAFVDNNLILDNNVGLTVLGGDYRNAGPDGNYSLITDNVITSGAHKESPGPIGGLTFGIRDHGALSTLVDNIVTHLADPNSNELNWKDHYHDAVASPKATYYDDTIIYNWASGNYDRPDQNIEGLNTGLLDQTTIQLFTAELTGNPNADIGDLADYLRAQANGALDDVVDAELIIRFFQEGFGIAPDIRDAATTLRFVPDDLGDGVRWDNRLNWDTDDLPGLFADDDVDLGGNHVVFGTMAEIGGLDFGPNGALNVYGGRLTLNDGMTGSGDLDVVGAGQVWTNGAQGTDVNVDVTSGRFVNTGDVSGVDLIARGGETVLATGGAEYNVSAGQRLAVFEQAAKIGFDGDDGGIAILDFEEGSTLAFSAHDGSLSTIEEFRSGAYGDAPDVQSGVDLGNTTLTINLAGLSANAGTAFTLMDTDEIVGIFNEASINGLGARNATILVDYENDSVSLQLSAGNGSVTVETQGVQSDVSSGEQALWDALTAGQGVVSETASGLIPEEEDILDAA